MKKEKRIKWTYTHYLNSRTSTTRSKTGRYYGRVKHTRRYQGPQLAVVWFDGNKSASRVPFDELIFEGAKGGK